MTLSSNYIAWIAMLQILILCMIVPANAQNRPQPEIATGLHRSTTAKGDKFMIVTANPHATKAGYDILKRGGTAADAAIAAQLVLGLVEPQSSGIGGGAFVLYYDAQQKKLSTYDARETAPLLTGPFHFFENGEPMKWPDAVLGGRSVGVPGIPALLQGLHKKHGKATWMELFDEARSLSKDGFEVSPRMSKMVDAHADRFRNFPDTAAYFLPNDTPVQVGDILKNPTYAETLKDMAFYGGNAFYRGNIAKQIVRTVQNIDGSAGLLTMEDFRSYQVKQRDPVCVPYRSYVVCAMGQPSSGGLTILQALGFLEHYDLSAWGADNPKSWSAIAQASRIAFADRNLYMADPDFVNTPGIALIDPSYIAERRKLINLDQSPALIKAGKPPAWDGPLYEEGDSLERPGTSHISIIDQYGNALSMTTTIESAFGSHVMVGGFLLNNELTDFSFNPIGEDGKLVANMVEAGKRPRSSMSPTIVFDKTGAPVFVVGSAGGSRIIGYVLQRLIAVLDWGMDVDKALAMPHILARGETIEMEQDRFEVALQNKGYKTKVAPLNSGMTAIYLEDGNFIGAADPRREGIGMGE